MPPERPEGRPAGSPGLSTDGERTLEDILAIWNARLNPPGQKVKDLDYAIISGRNDLRNELIEKLSSPDKKIRDSARTEINNIDQMTDAPLALFDLPGDRKTTEGELSVKFNDYSNREFKVYKEMGEEDLSQYINDLSTQLDEDFSQSGYSAPPEGTRKFVQDNLFSDWELDRAGRATRIYEDSSGRTPSETIAYDLLSPVSNELAKSPQYMTFEQKYWLGIDKAIAAGRIPSVYKSILDDKSVWTEETAAVALESLGIDSGTDSLEKLDDIADRFEETWESNLKNLEQGARTSGNVEKYFENLMFSTDLQSEIGPEDIIPRMGAEELIDQDKYSQFTAQNWNFKKSIKENVETLMAVNDKDFGGEELSNLDPNSKVWPPDLIQRFETLSAKNIQSAAGSLQRALIEKLETSTAGEAYTKALNAADDNPSLEQAFDVFKIFDTRIGENGDIFMNNLIGDLTSIEQTAWVDDMSGMPEREKMAKEYLSRIEGVRDNVETSDIRFVANELVPVEGPPKYISLGEMLADDDLRQTVTDRVQQRIADQPFDPKEAGRIPGRQAILQRILEKELSETDYQAYLSASPEQQMALQGLVGNYSSEAEALADPEFRRILNENISAGYGTIKEERRGTLNAEIEEKLFEEYQSRGMITEDTSPEFLNHLVKNVFPKLSQQALLGGGVDTEEQITAMLDDLPAYDLNEADYTRQMDPDTPPPIPGLQVSRYTKAEAPPFALESVTDDLMNMGIDRPEYARFVQQQMGLPGFAEEWRREGAEQFDEQAFMSAAFGDVGQEAFDQQKTKLDSFERQYEEILARDAALKETSEDGTGLSVEELEQAEKRIAGARRDFAREVAASPMDPEERTRLEAVMAEDYEKVLAIDEARKERGEEGLTEQELQKGEFAQTFQQQYQPIKEAIEREETKQALLQSEARKMQRDYEAAKKETVGTGFEPSEDPEVMQQVAKYSDEQLAGMQSAIEAKELEASAMDEGIAGMEKGAAPAKFFTTTEFRDQEREKQTTPGITSQDFFASKLPGFEERYKESPFFRLEQQRKEQEEEREQVAKRRPLLRTGGRGRTVVTRGRA